MTDIISFPPKLSKLSHAKLAQLSSEEFANIRESIKKRNRRHLHKNKIHSVDRKLILKKYPNKRIEHIPLLRSQMARLYDEAKPSEILDFFNSQRGEKWKRGYKRKKLQNRITIQHFSFIDYPNETLDLFYKFAEYEPKILEAFADFVDDRIYDIAPYLLWGIVKKDMYPYIRGGKISNRVSNVIKGLDLDKFMDMRLPNADDRNVIALPPIMKPRRTLVENQNVTTLDVSATRLVEKINEWLIQLDPPMALSDEGCVNVTSFTIEILENAQRHSVKGEEGNWYMTSFMEYRDGKYFCSLSFINTGMPIYESILSTTNDSVKQELDAYIKMHKNISSNILATVYALQDGSTRENYKDSRGGIGMLRMVKFINEIGDTSISEDKPQIAIISGNVCIKFSDKYGNAVKLSNNKNYQWFNLKQDRTIEPDKKYAYLLHKAFPGTIITTRFMLDAESLQKKVKNNDDN